MGLNRMGLNVVCFPSVLTLQLKFGFSVTHQVFMGLVKFSPS